MPYVTNQELEELRKDPNPVVSNCARELLGARRRLAELRRRADVEARADRARTLVAGMDAGPTWDFG